MKNFLVVVPAKVGRDEVRSWVIKQGGYWHDSPTLDKGVIEKDLAHVYITVGDFNRAEYDPDELAQLIERLGAEPASSIVVHIGHGRGSDELAAEVQRKLLERWGGVVDQ